MIRKFRFFIVRPRQAFYSPVMLPNTTWRPELVLRLMMGVLASISLGIILVHGLKLVLPEAMATQMLIFCVGTLSFHGVTLALVHVFLREHFITWRQAFGFGNPRMGRSLLLAFVAALVVLPIAWSLGDLSKKVMEMIQLKVEAQPAVQALQTAESTGQRVYFGIVAICVAPVVEELIFRGILYPFVKQAGFRRIAVWAASILFALSHANTLTFVPLTFIGVVLTLLYETTGTLFAPMLTHSLFNAANFFWMVTRLPS